MFEVKNGIGGRAVSGSFCFLQGLESFCGHMVLKFLILPKQPLKSVEIQAFCIEKQSRRATEVRKGTFCPARVLKSGQKAPF